jgi:hypothetical protein
MFKFKKIGNKVCICSFMFLILSLFLVSAAPLSTIPLSDNFAFFVIILIILIAIVYFGFHLGDGWFVVFGGIGWILFGMFIINNGIVGYKDMFISWGIGIIMIGVGTYLAGRSTIEMVQDNMGE